MIVDEQDGDYYTEAGQVNTQSDLRAGMPPSPVWGSIPNSRWGHTSTE